MCLSPFHHHPFQTPGPWPPHCKATANPDICPHRAHPLSPPEMAPSLPQFPPRPVSHSLQGFWVWGSSAGEKEEEKALLSIATI